MASVALLAADPVAAFATAAAIDSAWPSTLATQYAEDAAQLAALYPQLTTTASSSSSTTAAAAAAGDWTCPLRAATFWGGAHPAFGPVAPHPPLAAALFSDLGGAHPLVRPRRLRRAFLQPYQTTNGACFYPYQHAVVDGSGGAPYVDAATGAPVGLPQVSVDDVAHPCGLQGMLKALHAQTWVPARVMSSTTARCNWLLDAPDTGGRLRSGETLAPTLDTSGGKRCGALDRVAPFLMRTRGDGGRVVVTPNGTSCACFVCVCLMCMKRCDQRTRRGR